MPSQFCKVLGRLIETKALSAKAATQRTRCLPERNFVTANTIIYLCRYIISFIAVIAVVLTSAITDGGDHGPPGPRSTSPMPAKGPDGLGSWGLRVLCKLVITTCGCCMKACSRRLWAHGEYPSLCPFRSRSRSACQKLRYCGMYSDINCMPSSSITASLPLWHFSALASCLARAGRVRMT